MDFKNLVIFFLLLISCDNRKSYLINTLKEYSGNKIIFNDTLETKIYGKNIDNFLIKGNYTILNYIDSSGCSACRLKLYQWKLLKEELDSINLNLNFIFVIWTKDYKEIEYLQKVNQVNIPIIYDYNGSFIKENRIPDILGLQTFLLDEENRITILGNPVENEKVKKLIISELTHNKTKIN